MRKLLVVAVVMMLSGCTVIGTVVGAASARRAWDDGDKGASMYKRIGIGAGIGFVVDIVILTRVASAFTDGLHQPK